MSAADATGPSLQEGVLVDCTVSPGSGIEWMMYRKAIAGKRQVTLFQSVEWAGKKPFPAFAFRIVRKEGKTTRSYQFVLPKACSNLSLLQMAEETEQAKAHSLTPSVKSTCDCNNGKLTAAVSVTGDTANLRRVRVLVDGNAVGELTAPSWSMTAIGRAPTRSRPEGGARRSVHVQPELDPRGGVRRRPAKVAQTCSVKLTHVEGKKGYDFLIDASGTTSGSPNVPATTVVQLYGPAGAAIGEPITLTGDMKTTVTVPFKKAEGSYRVTSTVSSPDTVADCKHYGGKDNCEATDTVVAVPSTSSIFIDGLFGKERRERPASEYDIRRGSGDRGATRCSASARRCSGSRSATPSGSRTTGRPPVTVAWRSTCRPASLATASTRSTRRRCWPISRRTST